MRTLLILRHAKSSWEDRDLADHDRPLNPRGVHDAPRMGKLLLAEELVPELIISSTANRARSTAELVLGQLPDRPELETTRDLYLASPHTYVEVVEDLGGPADPVMVVGHNPGITALVTLLTGVCEEMPTAALAAVRLEIDDWSALGEAPPGDLMGFWRPKELDF